MDKLFNQDKVFLGEFTIMPFLELQKYLTK